MIQSNLYGANLNNCSFEQAFVCESDLRETQLSAVSFKDVVLSGVKMHNNGKYELFDTKAKRVENIDISVQGNNQLVIEGDSLWSYLQPLSINDNV